MERVLELEIPASPEYIAIVRLIVSSLASSRRALADERIDDLKLAVSEACTNAIEAQDTITTVAQVTVGVLEDDDRLEIHIADRGPGFDPAALPIHPPVTDPDRLNFERGLGIPLIRTLVDDVAFESTPEGTTVRLILYSGPADLELSENGTAET
ncbi:MAG TPA: ATP-binding protein [Acidimicrobiales bacterium]|jgi:serine/threonine-protein kinase RsbW|nr:ATP-binding protein [Acidimicrobiales bacterium]